MVDFLGDVLMLHLYFSEFSSNFGLGSSLLVQKFPKETRLKPPFSKDLVTTNADVFEQVRHGTFKLQQT